MRKLILVSIILLSFFELNAQINKINHYKPGTKVSIYPDQCGEEISGTEGKLTFCRGEDFGVVDQSFGLDSKVIKKMVPNYYNNDLVFITAEGLSIQKEDGTWDNVPNRAFPESPVSPEYKTIVQNAVVLGDGTIAMTGIFFGQGLDIYNMNEKSMSYVAIPEVTTNNSKAIIYDEDRDLCWVLFWSSSVNSLYKYENGELTFAYELDDDQFLYSDFTDAWQYDNNRLFKIGTSGLAVIEIDDDSATFIETFHDQSTSGTLPYDWCNDMEIDNNGFVWITQSDEDGDIGSIAKYNPEDESFQFYEFENPTAPGEFVVFSTIGQDRNSGLMWLKTNSLGGLVNLEIIDDQPIWNSLSIEDFEAEGIATSSQVFYIHTQGERTFFCTSTNISFSNLQNEILVLEDDNWSDIDDDEEGNISSRSLMRFQGSYSDDNGGVWWLNKEDNDLTYLMDGNNFVHSMAYDPFSERVACMNQDQNLVLGTEEGFGALIPPSLIPFEETSFPDQHTVITSWSNEVWAASTEDVASQYLVRYINGEVVQEFETDEIPYHFNFAMTTDKKGVFVQYSTTTETIVKIFDPISEEFSELIYPEGLGQIVEVIPAEDGKFWIIAEESLLFYDGSEFEYYDNWSLGSIGISSASAITSAVLDQDQSLHFLLESGRLYTIAPPYNNYEIESFYGMIGWDGLLTYYEVWDDGLNALALDSDGDLWMANRGSLIELQRENGVPEFNVNDIVGVEELSQNNLDFEMYPNPNITGQLRIILPEGFGKSTLSIFDMQGKLEVQNTIQRSNAEVDLKNITSGMYMVQISNADYTISKKLVVE